MKKLKYVFRILATGSVTMLLSACYGVMEQFNHLLRVTNNTDDPIPELKITYKESSSSSWQYGGVTDSNGEAYISSFDYIESVKIEDIDGSDNLGEFETKTLSTDSDDLSSIILTEK